MTKTKRPDTPNSGGRYVRVKGKLLTQDEYRRSQRKPAKKATPPKAEK